MFNLLISGNKEAWENGSYEIEASRYLEYTISSIADKLRPLSENITTLLNIPCLFGYEGKQKPYRFGWLTKITDRDKRIYIEYKFDEETEPIAFEVIEKMSMALDIRDWEINRTHWAVKDGELSKILDSIESKTRQDVIIKVPSSKVKIGQSGKVSTVTGFIQKIFDIEKNESCEVFYRGHSNRLSYKLEPSLFRRDTKGNYLYLQNEDILYRELLVSNSIDFQGDVYTLDRLVRMQHYSLPTRMLDITSNPLISLYFACSSQQNSEGEVIIFTIDISLIKYFDSDTASCISNLARLPQNVKDNIDYSSNDFNNQESIQKLLHLIKEEKLYFMANIIPEDLQKIICVKSKMTNNRIISQSGAFLLFGHEAIMNERGLEGIGIKRISITNKDNILKELDSLNINERTMFPYIENSAKYIRKKYEVKH
jgi:hypothetical protein